jgi:ABC-type phosphate transport system substrate-binding protein
MAHRTRLVSRLAALLLAAAPASALAADPVVVVHPSNPATSLTRREVVRYFLRQSSDWPTGEHVRPVDQSKSSPVRQTFSSELLGKSIDAVEQYWIQAVFAGRAVPPLEKRGDAEVLAYVRDNPGAIGYVSAGASLDGVKRLPVRSD